MIRISKTQNGRSTWLWSNNVLIGQYPLHNFIKAKGSNISSITMEYLNQHKNITINKHLEIIDDILIEHWSGAISCDYKYINCRENLDELNEFLYYITSHMNDVEYKYDCIKRGVKCQLQIKYDDNKICLYVDNKYKGDIFVDNISIESFEEYKKNCDTIWVSKHVEIKPYRISTYLSLNKNSDDEIINEIQRFITQYGTNPTEEQMFQYWAKQDGLFVKRV